MQAVAASTPLFEGPAVLQEEGRCSVEDLTFTFLDNVGADCQLKIFFPFLQRSWYLELKIPSNYITFG